MIDPKQHPFITSAGRLGTTRPDTCRHAA